VTSPGFLRLFLLERNVLFDLKPSPESGFLRLRDGKLVQEYQEWDQAAMLRQLGLLPERDSAQERALRGLANLRTEVTQALGR